MPSKPSQIAGAGLLLLATLALFGCETTKPQVQVPPQRLYFEGEALEDQGLTSEAITKFQQVVDQNPGTRLGTLAYFKLGELNMKKEDWAEAENNYRLFLTLNSSSHLTSYVLYRLMMAHNQKSYTGLFFPEREVDRDMEPNRQIIKEYTRFYFLYPQSQYLEDAKTFYRDARETLAEHERLVADFYYSRDQYNAAASRYYFLLRTYPQYRGAKSVLGQLILSYRRNQQPELAREMERIYQTLYHEPFPEQQAPSAPDVALQRGPASPQPARTP